MTNDKNRNNEFPAARIRHVLNNAPARFVLVQFAHLYQAFYGHGDKGKGRDLARDCYSWKKLAAVLIAEGAQQIGEYAVRETRFANPIATAPQKETPAPAKPSPAPVVPTTTIERLEARLQELQRVVDLQTKIKEVEAQIALF